jgi:chromosome segregation ATPase
MASSARSRPSATSNRQNRGPTPLPVYQPPQHPLNESAQRALQNLQRDHKLDSLKQKLKIANNHLTTAAADINDRFQIQSMNYEKQRKRLEKQGSQDSSSELDTRIAEARAQTDEMTGKLDGGVRNIIDASAQVESMEKALKELQENVRDGGDRVVPTQSTLGASYNRPARSGRRQRTASEDEGSDSQADTTQPIPEDESVVGVLKRKVAGQQSAYQAMSMARRYVHPQ